MWLSRNPTHNFIPQTTLNASSIPISTGGMVEFTSNTALQSALLKQIAADTVQINNGVTVNVTGNAVDVYTNNANYTGSGGNASTTGTFTGSGATTNPLSSAPF